jgi:aromatic ring-opening dioxygenase catalytic subunit (LigB family)
MDDKIRVGTKTNPDIVLPLVQKERYENYPVNIDQGLAQRVIDLLKAAGLPDVEGDPTAHWEDAPTTPSLWMFPQGTLPSTTVSLNGRYDPVFHVRIGHALRPLREQGILIIASGATVHNIFRGSVIPMVLKRDHFQRDTTPAKWAADFDQSIYDVIEGTTVSHS